MTHRSSIVSTQDEKQIACQPPQTGAAVLPDPKDEENRLGTPDSSLR